MREASRRFEASLHRIAATGVRVHVLDKGDTQRTTAVLVSSEFGYNRLTISAYRRTSTKEYRKHTNSGFANFRALKLDHTSAARPAVGFILNLRTLDFADRREEIHQILVASGPWQLV